LAVLNRITVRDYSISVWNSASSGAGRTAHTSMYAWAIRGETTGR